MQHNSLGKVVYFLPDISGGISSVIKKLAAENQLVVLIASSKHITAEKHPENYFNAETVDFQYHVNENLHAVCKRLAKSIPNQDYIIVANDWLELEMVARLALPNRVIHIVHGDYDYYYELARKYSPVINAWIGVSEYITCKLKSVLADRENDIEYLPIGVDVVSQKKVVSPKTLNVIFAARLVEGKGYFDLFKIDGILKKRNVIVDWIIAGDTGILDCVPNISNFKYLGKLNHGMLMTILPTQDLFILPSRQEGFPVSLIEAMKCGLVPMVTNLRSGVPEIVINGKNGFVFEIGDFEGYADILEHLNNNRKLLHELSRNAHKSLEHKFQTNIFRQNFNKLIIKISGISLDTKRIAFFYVGSRLDKKNIPNCAVISIRTIAGLKRIFSR